MSYFEKSPVKLKVKLFKAAQSLKYIVLLIVFKILFVIIHNYNLHLIHNLHLN